MTLIRYFFFFKLKDKDDKIDIEDNFCIKERKKEKKVN